MSGIEIAGLVLGAFPLLISAAEHYRESYQLMRNWWRFEAYYSEFRDSVTTEQVLFEEYMISVLEPVLDTDGDAERLCNELGSSEWKNPALETALREHLGSLYPLILIAFKGMNKVMVELEEKLGIDVSKSSGEIRYELKRIKFCLHKKTTQSQLAALRRHNQDLWRILDVNQKVQPVRVRRQKAFIARSLKGIQERALSLHGILTRGWQCRCSAHRAHLLLERRPPPEKIDHTTAVQFSIGFEIQPTPSNPQWHESVVEITEEDAVKERPAEGSKQRATSESPATSQSMPLWKQVFSFSPGSRHQRKLGSQPSSQKSGVVQDVKSVRFNSTVSDESNVIGSKPIDDLCSAVRDLHLGPPATRYILDEWGRRHTFRCGTFGIGHGNAIKVKLADLLRKNSTTQLHRPDRLRLAAVLASSTLQLYETPWLYEFNKSNITCIVAANTLDTSSPFLITNFPTPASTAMTQITSPTVSNSKKTLLRLGILLLELCYGEAFEDQEFRKDFIKDGRTSDFADRAAAGYWQKAVYDELGAEFAEAIRRCIVCDFECVSLSLSDAEFRQNVYNNVVDPIEQTWKRYIGSS